MKLRYEGRVIYYLFETWLNAGHIVGKVGVDTTLCSARDAEIRDVQTGLRNPSDQGSRVIMTYVGYERVRCPL